MGLLFINALKGIKKKKIQIIAIIALVALSAAIYTAMNTSLDRLEDRYYEYLTEQNVEEFSFIPVIDYESNITLEIFNQLLETNFKNVNEDEKQLLLTYKKCLINSCQIEDYTLTMQIENIFKKYKANLEITKNKIDELADKYDFKYEIDDAKVFKENKYIYKAMPYKKDKQINKPYLIEGDFPEKDNEITVLRDFAIKNNLKIGDILTVNNQDYKIVGYVFASDHIYPLISLSTPFFDNKYNNIMFMNENTYQKFNGVNEVVLSAKLNTTNLDYRARFEVTFSEEGSQDTNKEPTNPIELIIRDEKETINIGMESVIRFLRTDMIKAEFEPNRIFTESFMYLLLGISVFVIGVVTKKRIDDEKLQIGVLKSLGYNSFAIATSYLVYPLIGSIVGGVIGYTAGIFLNEPITSLYKGYYNLPFNALSINLSYLSKSVFTPLIMLSILCYLISLFMLRKKPLKLLKEGSNLKINIFSRIVTFITKPLPFKSRFKYSLAFRSLGKLFIVSLTSLSAGLLIVLTLIGVNLFNSMIDKTFESVKYDYIVNYYTIRNDSDSSSDLLLETSQKIIEIKDEKGNIKELLNEDSSTFVLGVDPELKNFDLLDKNKESLVSKLNNGVIINENLKELMNINMGDTIKLDYNGSINEYKVVGVAEEFFTSNIYIDRETLSNDLGIELSYNKKYTNDNKYSNNSNIEESELNEISNIIDFVDLKRNIGDRMQSFNSAVYIVIAFASLMSLIIISVIANIVVEENKKTISLMKVMGYKNKEISKVVLNIYTPFVVVFYLLSIPLMINILKSIIGAITQDIEMTIPITISPVMAALGLVGLVFAYYIAVAISRRVLNKVPLAIALKRE